MDSIIFQLLSLPHNCKNDKQIKAIINSLTRKQKYKIQRFIKNILNGKIPLNDAEYRKLSKHKTFICSLKGGKVNVKSLLRNYNIFSEIINVMLTNSKMNQIKKMILVPFEEWKKMNVSKIEKAKMKPSEKLNRQEKLPEMKKISVEKIPLTMNPISPQLVKKKIWKKKISLQRNHQAVKMKKKMSPVNNVKMMKVMKKIPSDLKIKAKGLLLFFKDIKIIDWNSNGEIYVNSKIINKSNIIKFIKHALTNNKEKPIGYKKIYGEIKIFKIPSFLNENN